MKTIHLGIAVAASFLMQMAALGSSGKGMLIENALIADGTGADMFNGDVRVRDGQIIAIGDLAGQPGEQIVDAGGKVLAPGFIDTHSHHEGGLAEDPGALEAVSQGITTIVTGQDGGSEIPLSRMFAAYTARPVAINIASYSGHNSIRGAVMGEDYKREATPDEIAKMRALLAEDMRAGALGLSTGLEYDPGIYSSHDEVLTLAREAAASGGRYISHIRSEDRDLWSSVDELIRIGRETGMPVQVSHAKLAMTDWWGQAGKFIGKLDRARADGVNVTLDIYPYDYWHSGLSVLWPERNFDNRPVAEFILAHLTTPTNLRLVSFPPEPLLAGKTIADIAKQQARDPVTVLMDLVQRAADEAKGARILSTSMDERDMIELMKWPYANFCSDGALKGSHPRGAGAFPRALGRYVRDLNVMPLTHAIYKMTGLSARNMGISDRGIIRPGARADLVLFDPATVKDNATVEHNTALASGILKTWVNGELVYSGGKATGAHPGQIIRRESRQ
ncbi:N-acyl-D-amino-acid deacylase family protein [Sphingorhabdus sp.]|jgi:N-acyl-D-amino-acid deacylase|uniref:N-acyl-D-amino-acid deacylase family protein n=1 Tax=Sphingorhabdus sp. TaxID=1902408 RepID=UPI003BB1147E|nr:D-aminoacylase [Sphingomonadales bacterium]